MRYLGLLALTFCLANPVFAQTQGSVEDVQIKSINFETQVLELHNFGSVVRPMDGWRFCTHDENVVLRYSSSTGMNGLELDPGESLFLHWLNDSGGAPGTIDRSTIGGGWIPDLLATTAGSAISIGIYRSGGFGQQANLNDHVQYSFGGVHVAGATPRSGPATASGLWAAADDWISVGADTISIEMVDDPFPGGTGAHGSTSYEVTEPTVTEELPAETATIVTGDLGSGSVSDLETSDNVDYSVRRSNSSIASVVSVDLKTTTSIEGPSTLFFTYEGSVFARGAVTQTISLFNYDTGSFEQVDTRAAARFSDSTVEIEASGDLSRFVESGTGCMEARIRFNGSTPRLQFSANMDQALWTITN